MALYIPHSIFHLARLLYFRLETFGSYYIMSINIQPPRTPENSYKIKHGFSFFRIDTNDNLRNVGNKHLQVHSNQIYTGYLLISLLEMQPPILSRKKISMKCVPRLQEISMHVQI